MTDAHAIFCSIRAALAAAKQFNLFDDRSENDYHPSILESGIFFLFLPTKVTSWRPSCA